MGRISKSWKQPTTTLCYCSPQAWPGLTFTSISNVTFFSLWRKWERKTLILNLFLDLLFASSHTHLVSSQNSCCQLHQGTVFIWDQDHTKVSSVGPSEDVLIGWQKMLWSFDLQILVSCSQITHRELQKLSLNFQALLNYYCSTTSKEPFDVKSKSWRVGSDPHYQLSHKPLQSIKR